jgi:SAM-dependent methyltransferase
MNSSSAKSATLINTYNKYAAQFVTHFETRPSIDQLEAFLKLVPAGGYFLDAGCGSARDAAYALAHGYKVLGIDLSTGLLEEASKLHPEVPTQVMSLTDITLRDEEFDAVWCMAALLHLDRQDVPAVLQSFNRILRPGGHLFVKVKAGMGEGSEKVSFDETLTRDFTYFTLLEMTELIKQVGFTILENYQYNGKGRYDRSRNIDWIVVVGRK